MVFVTVGAREFPFNRLIEKVDTLAAAGALGDVLAQIGCASYIPRFCRFQTFVTHAELEGYIEQADFIICHAGAGTLDECLCRRKKVIVVPRLQAYGEAPDDHQLELSSALYERGRILVADDLEKLGTLVQEIHRWTPVYSSPSTTASVVSYINGFILDNFGPQQAPAEGKRNT